MDCADAKLKMEPYASGDLAEAERALLDEHLSRCEGCRLEMELVRAIGASGRVEVPKGNDASEWTLDRIFGAGERPESAQASTPEGASTPAAAPDSLPEAPPPLNDSLSDAPQEAGSAQMTPQSEGPEVSSFDASASVDSALAEDQGPISFVDLDRLGEGQREAPGHGSATSGPSAIPPASALQLPTSSARSAAASKGESSQKANWDFEPVDAKPSVNPPTGSLFFAEETLERQREADAKKRGGPMRLALWGVGGLIGVAFLVLSAWIALHGRVPKSMRSAPPSGATEPSLVSPTPPAPSSGDVAASLGSSGSPLPQAEAPASDGTESEAPSTSSETAIPAPAQLDDGSTEAPEPREESVGGGTVEAPVRAAPSPRRPTRAAPLVTEHRVASRPAARTPAPAAQVKTSPHPAAAKAKTTQPGDEGSTPVETERRNHEVEPIPLPNASSTPAPREPEAPSTRSSTPEDWTWTESGEVAKTPEAVRPREHVAPPSRQQESPAPPEPAADRPIDHIHQATVGAEEHGDLATLRRLRVTWKGLIQKSGVGQDRVRAKREYADCLWAIQTLTGRSSDQKAALLAYRDYILTSPAGGADSRSVGRTRLLEDALSESH